MKVIKKVPFPSFKVSFNELIKIENQRVLVEFYHNDTPSEPTVSILNDIVGVFYGTGFLEDEHYISIRFKEGTDLTFSSEVYNTNLSNDSIVFSSLADNETYCIIHKVVT